MAIAEVPASGGQTSGPIRPMCFESVEFPPDFPQRWRVSRKQQD